MALIPNSLASIIIILTIVSVSSFLLNPFIKFRSILENTVVDVLDTADVKNVIWLYVSIPVYDTPINYKGWIKETDTVRYSKEI
jgi:hypothetical protein